MKNVTYVAVEFRWNDNLSKGNQTRIPDLENKELQKYGTKQLRKLNVKDQG